MSMQQQSQSQQQLQQQRRWFGGKSPLTLDVVVPDERTATQLVTDATQNQVIREVTFRRDGDGTPRIRISLQPEAAQEFQEHVQKLTDSIQRSYQSAGYTQQ